MRLIPVLDLMGGAVVRAVRGQRSHYQPIQSRVCEGHDPATVARALCDLTDADTLYIADLDALQGGAAQIPALRAIAQALPTCRLWLDVGLADLAQAHTLMASLGALAERVDPVFASESLRDTAALAACFDRHDAVGRRGLLSLDRRDGQRLDAAGCWEHPEHWPDRVIVMTLERVGADLGPDFDTLAEVRQRALATDTAPHTRQWIGAGGVRHAADLALAERAGAHAWLVASALHDGRWP